MTKIEMLAKIKNHKNASVGVIVTTSSGDEICYFYEDFEGSMGIDRAMKQVYPLLDNGKAEKVVFVA